MTEALKPQTSQTNGDLWGASARDWADIQEITARPAYEAALTKTLTLADMNYLDVGCGSGLAAQIAASKGARVSGIDASEELLTIAKSRVGTGDFRTGDLEDLPFDDNMFDVITGFNAFQYAGNPGVALGEAKRIAKPGGTIVIMTWGEPDGMEAASLVTALGPLLPPPPPGAPGPFALSDEKNLRAFASGAGLTPREVFDVPCPFAYKDEATAIRGLNSSGVSEKARQNTSAEAVTKANAAALIPFRQADGSYLAMASFRCLLASP